MVTYHFRVGCELNYNVTGPSAFIFNVSVVNNSLQRILSEAISTEPQLQIEESRSPIEEKRLHRLSAGPGPLRVQVLGDCRVVSLRSARRERAGDAARRIAGRCCPIPLPEPILRSGYARATHAA